MQQQLNCHHQITQQPRAVEAFGIGVVVGTGTGADMAVVDHQQQVVAPDIDIETGIADAVAAKNTVGTASR